MTTGEEIHMFNSEEVLLRTMKVVFFLSIIKNDKENGEQNGAKRNLLSLLNTGIKKFN